jgi:hypothetical protein
MIYTTLNRIREDGPCTDGWQKLLKHLNKTAADDEPLALLTVLESNGLDDTLWCLRSVPEHNRLWRHYAVDCAEQVKHLMTDPRSHEALRVARLYADGLATDEELAATRAAARDATGDAAWAAARAAARDAARDAAWAATGDAARDWQRARLVEYITTGERPQS